MIDHLRIVYPFRSKDSINLSALVYIGEDKRTSWKKYLLQGFKDIKVWINDRIGLLRVDANFMYFAQGHNFSFDMEVFIDAVNYVGSLMSIDLWEGDVEQLECFVIVEVDEDSRSFIKAHKAPKGYREDYRFDTSKCFIKGKAMSKQSAEIYLKMYDVVPNLKKKRSNGVDLQEIGIKPDKYYIKFEIHYNKPYKYLNKGVNFKLRELFEESMQSRMKSDLMCYYEQIKRDCVVVPPNKKSDLKTATIFALCVMENAVNVGESACDVLGSVYKRINQIPIFTSKDKDNRKRQAKIEFDKVGQNAQDKWNLTHKIGKVLENVQLAIS